MRRTLVLWLLLFLAACGPPSIAGPGQPPPAGTPIRIVTRTPTSGRFEALAAPPTAPPPDYTPPTPAPTTTAYPLPPTATLAPSSRLGRLLFSFPWPNSGPIAAPPGIAVGRDGTVFVTDVTQPGIHRFTSDGQPIDRWDIPPLPNGPPAPQQNAGPQTLAVAGDGSLYVPLWDGMRHLTPDGRPLTPWPVSSPVSAASLAVGPDTTVYTTNFDRSQVARFTADGAPLGAWNGSRPDQPFRAAQAVAVGLDGTVYVADLAANSIYLFASDGNPVGDWVGAPNGTGELYMPVALTVAPDGTLFVLEGRRHRVSRFDPTGRLLEWWDGPADGGRAFAPTALAASADGRVYVVDYGNQRVQVYAYTPLGPPVPSLAATPPPPPPIAMPTQP